MRIVFCGSGDVAVPTLERLAGSGHEIQAVVTQPPRNAGRGGKLRPTPTHVRACTLGLTPVQTPNINHAEPLGMIQGLGPDLIVVVDFGQKLGLEVCQTARLGAINMHASLLPRLRGAAPINWAIVRGHTHTGVTTFRLVDRMDAGPVFMQETTEIAPDETAEDLRVRLAELGAELTMRTVEALALGLLDPAEQDESLATSAPKLTKDDGVIDFTADAVSLANRIRGVWPWPGAHADFEHKTHEGRPPTRVILALARPVDADAGDTEPGTIADDLTVQTGSGRLKILRLKVAGKRLMEWKDFVNGYRVAPGDRFVDVAT